MPGKSSWWIDQNYHYGSCFHPNLATRIWYHSIVLKSVGLFVVYFNWPRTTQYAESKYSSFLSNICERKAGESYMGNWRVTTSRQVTRNGQSSKGYPTLIAKPQPAHFVTMLHYFQAKHDEQCTATATQVNFNVSGHCARTIMCTMNFVLQSSRWQVTYQLRK